MSKHTPGPWRAEMNGFCRMAVIDKKYRYLTYKAGSDRMSDEELEANANLIAAAPDLLEALKRMFSTIEDSHIPGAPGSPIEMARAAIDKATGESA